MARGSKNVMSRYRRGEGGGEGVGVGVLPTTCTQGFATSRMHIYSIWLVEKFSYVTK